MLLSAGEIIKNSWQIFAGNFRKMISYMILLFVPNLVLSFAGIFSLYLDNYVRSDQYVLINNIAMFALQVACYLFSLWVVIALTKNLGSIASQNAPMKIKEVLSNTSRQIWPYFYTNIIYFLVTSGVFLLLAIIFILRPSFITAAIMIAGTALYIIPSIIFAIKYYFCSYSVIFENNNGLAALQASNGLVTGRWWSILWRLFAPALFFLGVSIIIFFILSSGLIYFLNGHSYAFKALLINSIFSVVLAVSSPIIILISLLLYRSAKENPAPIKPAVSTEQK